MNLMAKAIESLSEVPKDDPLELLIYLSQIRSVSLTQTIEKPYG